MENCKEPTAPLKIDKPIVAFAVLANDSRPATATDLEAVHENLPRPEFLIGATYKIKPPMSDHALYVTINDMLLNAGTEYAQRHPYEVFINSKNMDHFQWVVALTRVISAVFRKGGDITFLVEELKAIFDPKGGYFKKGSRYMPSLVAEIGFAIEAHLQMIGLLESNQQHDTSQQPHADTGTDTAMGSADTSNQDFPESALLCMKCYTKARMVLDGCATCLNCGDSKCG